MSTDLSEFDLTNKPKKVVKKKPTETKTENNNENKPEEKEKEEIKKPKKLSLLDPKEVKKIEKASEKLFDSALHKKKKKRNPLNKIQPLKSETLQNDDTEDFLNKIVEY